MSLSTIKADENLSTVCRIIETTPEIFIEKTLNYLEVNEWVPDASEEWGRTIGECLNEYAKNPVGISILAIGTNDSVAMECFLNLIIIGKGDCPECGADLEKFEDGGYGKTWEVERCNCGYNHSTEPECEESY